MWSNLLQVSMVDFFLDLTLSIALKGMPISCVRKVAKKKFIEILLKWNLRQYLHFFPFKNIPIVLSIAKPKMLGKYDY